VLIDSRTEEIRYVGKTGRQLEQRLAEHLRTVLTKRTYRDYWISSLDASPRIELICEVPDQLGSAAEVFWIAYLRALGCRLTNGTDGGDGLVNPSPEVRARIAASVQKHVTPDLRNHLSIKSKEAWGRPEYRERQRASHHAYFATTEARERTAEATRRGMSDPRVRARLSVVASERRHSFATRARMALAQQQRRAREREQRQ